MYCVVCIMFGIANKNYVKIMCVGERDIIVQFWGPMEIIVGYWL